MGVSISFQVPASDPEIYKNKATDDILLFLSRHRFGEYTLTDLAAQTGHNKQTVRRAVDVLSANDLVRSNPDGNSRLVSINRERLAVPEDPYLKIPQREFQKPVKTAVDELTTRLETIVGIVLYGSVARGEADRRSDVDLWVLVSEDRSEAQRVANRTERDLEDREFESGRFDYDIDVESAASVPAYTDEIREIVLSGITVYETSQFDIVANLLMEEVDNSE